MLTLELDLVLAYIPPMIDRGAGICLTREIQLPFVPYNGLQLYGKQLDQAPVPEGFVLKDVTWDIDREDFMGQLELISHDLPMEDIPLDIGAWLDLGWRVGSCSDRYEEDEVDDDDDHAKHRPDQSTAACIDYIIMHEFCHLCEHNHGPAFFRLLSRCMPDWKQRKERLDSIVLR